MTAGSLGETNAEHTEEVSVSGLGLNESLNGGVPLLDNCAELVASDVHAIEVSVAVEALDFFDLDLHLSPGILVAVSVQISQRYLKHTAFQTVGRVLYINKWFVKLREKLTLTSGLVAGGKSGGSNVENGGDVDVVPFLLLEGVSAK